MKTLFREVSLLKGFVRIGSGAAVAMLAILLCLAGTSRTVTAQSAGEGVIEGTVTDSTGAVVPHATITITNVATSVATVRESTGAGFFSISPVLPGTYTVQVTAKGFKTLVQDNVVIDALQTRTISPILAVGTETQTVTVTGAPPVLDTADATIGLTVENTTYSNLPIQMSNAQRDPTAFGLLTPGAQTANNGGRLPIVGGTGSYLGQLYVDGMPAETVSQQGDNRLVSLTMSVDAVDQFQMVTSTPPAEYMGAGAENFTMKSGGLQYHGQVSDFVRNTAFDSWGFTAPHATTKNLQGQTVQAPKPVEHQNELSASFGGVVPKTAKKLFFFAAYDKYHERKGAAYQLYTIPSALMTQGNFTELNGGVGTGLTGTGSTNPAFLYDPTTTSCTGTTCTRQPFEYNGTYNVIPPGDISPITKAMESFLPTYSSSSPTYGNWNSTTLVNNYLGGYPSGYDNWVVDWRVDFNVSSNHRISSVGTMGTENYLNNYGSPFLPPPYIGGDLANIYPKNFIVEDAYTITPSLINQLKFGFTRFFQNIHDATQGVTAWEIGTLGATNLPGGQAGQEFPGASFGTTTKFGTAQQTWTGNGNSVSTQLTTPNNYALTDNVLWVEGRHALTMGMTFQWQEINNANPATLTGVLDLAFNAYSTANFSGTSLNDAGTGYSYASFLLGAVGGSTSNDTTAPSIGLDYVSELAGRYKTISPYIRDSYKVTNKLTLDLGLRWDYLPPYHELRNRWTFLNPTMTNPLTNSPGILQFAGNYGGAGVSCQCTTPVSTYFGNWGPRVGIAYSINNKTVIRTGFAQVFTQAGGVGGRGGAYNGTGQTGFNTTAIGPTESGNGASAGPAYWLNGNSAYLGSAANTALFGGAAYPAAPTPSVAAQELNTGFYVNSAGKFVSASSVSYADPHFSARAPELVLWNFGIERSITPSMTLSLNYVGNESHFIVNSGTTGGNARGLWTNQVNPAYLSILGPVLDSTGTKPLMNAQATPANLAILAQYAPNAPQPAFYTAAGAISSSATIQQMLTAFPQYSGVSDTWGNVGNFNYNALQLLLQQRTAHGLTFTVNYTYSKNIGDDGTYRSGFNIPEADVSGGTQAWKQDRIDRSLTAISTPQVVHVFGVYELPFGKGQIGGDSMLVRALAGGWQISENYSYNSGYPLAVTWSGASGTNTPGQGTGMPDLNTISEAYMNHNARINGSYGKGPNGTQFANLSSVQYVDPTAFTSPVSVSTAPNCTAGGRNEPSNCNAAYLIGSAPRTAPYTLRAPGAQDIDGRLSRSFPLHFENAQFVFEADCLNLWNKNTFGSPNASWSNGSTSFGTISSASGARDWQFAGHINF
jgi:hypothetical protein